MKLMEKKAITYKRMPGRGASFLFGHSLWRGEDHLLWVEGSVSQEHYKRFYYKDIQAVILRKTGRQHIWTVVWGLFALFFGALTLLGGGPADISFVFCGLFVVSLLINLWLGPGCVVYIQTAVQLQRLANLVRIPTALKSLDQIKAMVYRAQGGLDTNALSQFKDAVPTNAAGVQRVMPQEMAPLSGAKYLTPYVSTLHWLLFGVLLVAGIIRISQHWLRWLPLAVVDIIFLAATVVLAIVALVRWQSHVKGTLLSVLSWCTLVLVILHGLTDYIIFITGPIINPGAAYNEFEMLRLFWNNLIGEHSAVTTAMMIFAVGSTVLGVLGIISVFLYKEYITIEAQGPIEPTAG